ncbi:hypothetical protein QA601_17850 [Chitinispirillales bacterium ANBcel5]|nr:hypothetical protein [Chitinispirillales bacterium ANBcel5]
MNTRQKRSLKIRNCVGTHHPRFRNHYRFEGQAVMGFACSE